MEQPKFKFGEKVRSKKETNFFFVRIVKYSRTFQAYLYAEDEFTEFLLESEIEHWEDAKRKKLYAFLSIDGEIVFKIRETWLIEGDPEHFVWVRAPGFDIEFSGASNGQ
jgi:hypothetical protein